MKYVHIVATDRAGGIGLNGRLPWNCPVDMHWFRHATEGQTLIVGRKTYEDLVRRHEKKHMSRVSPLPGRRIIVLSKTLKRNPYVDVWNVDSAEQLESVISEQNLYFVIGGSEIYSLLKPSAVLLSVVDSMDHSVDTWYPESNFAYLKSLQTRDIRNANSNATVKLYVGRDLPITDSDKLVNLLQSFKSH